MSKRISNSLFKMSKNESHVLILLKCHHPQFRCIFVLNIDSSPQVRIECSIHPPKFHVLKMAHLYKSLKTVFCNSLLYHKIPTKLNSKFTTAKKTSFPFQKFILTYMVQDTKNKKTNNIEGKYECRELPLDNFRGSFVMRAFHYFYLFYCVPSFYVCVLCKYAIQSQVLSDCNCFCGFSEEN